MSEKRFDIIYDCQGVTRLIDRENKLISLDFGFDWNDLDNYEKDKVREWLDLLNEQQELKQKKIYIKRLEYKVQKFKEENEQLKQQLEIRTESDKYHQRMLMKWLCKDDGDGV